MFGSVVLEVFLGTVFFFLTFSLVVTTAQEMIAGVFGMRSANLVRAIRNLLDDPEHETLGRDLTAEIFRHPIIKRLYKGRHPVRFFGQIGRGPSYIPNTSFAIAVLDTLRRKYARDPSTVAPIPVDVLFERAPEIVRAMEPGKLKEALTLLVGEAQGSDRTQRRRSNSAELMLSTWFDQAMDRASGWYKRRSQAPALLLGLVVAVAVNANTLEMLQVLWSNGTLRQTLAEAAAAGAAGAATAAEGQQLFDQLAIFPVGWREGETLAGHFATSGDALRTVVGWLITALAVSLGSTFWFDMTKNVLRLRASGPKPDPARIAGGLSP